MTDPFDDWLDRQRVEPLAPRPGAFERVARSARRRRATRVALTSAAVALAVIAGGGLAYQLTRVPVPPPNPGASASASASPSIEARPGPSATGSASEAPTHSASGIARCKTADLKVTRDKPERQDLDADGNLFDVIIFTNVSAQPCTLLGYPGVSWIAGPGAATINKPAIRDFSHTQPKVTVEPQQSAHATIHWPMPDTLANCNKMTVDGYRVYVPDETASVFVPASPQVCATEGVGVARLGPIVPGGL